MTQRILIVAAVALGCLGIVAIAVAFLLGVDVRRAATTGPRWRRRLLAAGLVLLGASAGLGVIRSCRDKEEPVVLCYEMSLISARQSNLKAISQRLDLIERQLAGGYAPREALEQSLNNAVDEIQRLSASDGFAKLQSNQREQAAALAARVRAALDKLQSQQVPASAPAGGAATRPQDVEPS